MSDYEFSLLCTVSCEECGTDWTALEAELTTEELAWLAGEDGAES